jgi:hypothetical protein
MPRKSTNAPLDNSSSGRRSRKLALWVAIGLPLYIFSTGPVAWATNDAFHPRYLPDGLNCIYLPLAPLTNFQPVNELFQWWTAVVWGGFPAGYTTL